MHSRRGRVCVGFFIYFVTNVIFVSKALQLLYIFDTIIVLMI